MAGGTAPGGTAKGGPAPGGLVVANEHRGMVAAVLVVVLLVVVGVVANWRWLNSPPSGEVVVEYRVEVTADPVCSPSSALALGQAPTGPLFWVMRIRVIEEIPGTRRAGAPASRPVAHGFVREEEASRWTGTLTLRWFAEDQRQSPNAAEVGGELVRSDGVTRPVMSDDIAIDCA